MRTRESRARFAPRTCAHARERKRKKIPYISSVMQFNKHKAGREHIWDEGTPECEGCQFCNGGLQSCTVCGGAEGSLTADCIGFRLPIVVLDELVFNGPWDYLEADGWVRDRAAHIWMGG
jgi:hypothetical protein